MTYYQRCARCGSKWAYDAKFVYVEVDGEQYGYCCYKICPDCAEKVMLFLNDHDLETDVVSVEVEEDE